MAFSTRTLEQIELDLETAHAAFAEGLLDPAVSEDTKRLAAAIALAGSGIAVSVARADGRVGDGSA